MKVKVYRSREDLNQPPLLGEDKSKEINLKPWDIDRCKALTCKKEMYWITSPWTFKRICISKVSEGVYIEHHDDCTKPGDFSNKTKK